MEESESELDMLETPAARILNWLVRFQWLKKSEDYGSFVTNIVIPDYAAVFIEAFEQMTREGWMRRIYTFKMCMRPSILSRIIPG